MDPHIHHIPVMPAEALDALRAEPGGRYIDANLGEGGHTAAILERSAPDGRVLGIDADSRAVDTARGRLPEAVAAARLVTANVNFRRMDAAARQHGFVPVDGILFDLGLSSLQLDSEERGFSFRRPDPLDMRFSTDQELTAADIVNTYRQEDLANLIYQYGEERASRRIAAAIVRARPLWTATELADVIERAMPGRPGPRRIHPATRTFQALRIAVNDELGALEEALGQAIALLRQGGRLAVISYHSLEDRIAKNLIRRESTECICPPGTPVCGCGHRATLRMVTRRVIRPAEAEVRSNPRSRSARLRVAERT